VLHLNKAAVIVIGRFARVSFLVAIRHSTASKFLRLDLRVRGFSSRRVTAIVVGFASFRVKRFADIRIRVQQLNREFFVGTLK
jgi:hypothetical protein